MKISRRLKDWHHCWKDNIELSTDTNILTSQHYCYSPVHKVCVCVLQEIRREWCWPTATSSQTLLAFWKWQMWVISVHMSDCWSVSADSDLTNRSLSVCLSAESHLSESRRRSHFLPASCSHVREVDWGETRVRRCSLHCRSSTLLIQWETHTSSALLLDQVTVWQWADREH